MSRMLFVMLHPGFLRYYESALQALAAAGHDVHVAFETNRTKLGEDAIARRLAAVSPRLTFGATPERGESVRDFLARGDREATRSGGPGVSPWSREGRDEAWDSLGTTVRLLLDYLRFFDPVFARASALRARAEKRVPRVYRGVIARVAGTRAGRRVLAAALQAVEAVIPPNRAIAHFVREQRPDLLLVTPLIELGSQQVDYVKCARRLGIRSALCVASWDNLTSKGLIRVVPDHVMVWNEAQKREAVELHGVAPERVITTGAHLFDRWFVARPERSREAFCRVAGLDPARPYVLYVGSSVFIAPDEVPFVERWLAALRTSTSPGVASSGVLIRPHPANARQWRAFDAGAFSGVAIWPPVGTDPNGPGSAADYYESIYYSSAVVGINTSAQLEAAIVGRPVFTIRAPEFAHAQEGTLHFQHLAAAQGGLARVASSFDEHALQLAEALREGATGVAAREFVRAFLRPHGLDVESTTVFRDAIDDLARLARPAQRRPSWWILACRPPGFVLARLARALAQDRPLWTVATAPLLSGAITLWAAGFRAQETTSEYAGKTSKRVRRQAWRAWYESSRQIEKTLRRIRKKVVARVRGAGAAAKRVARRSVC